MALLRATLLAAVLAACYSPNAPSGVPCDNGACPSGQSCVAGVCVRPGEAIDGAPGEPDAIEDALPVDGVVDGVVDAGPDADGDGILDDVDNCPSLGNPSQHDEDSDMKGDVCDRCPHLADPADPDLDDDGVGDACDPLPTTNTETIVRFESFAGGIPPDWISDGNWLGGSDRAAVTSLSGERFALSPPDPALLSGVVVARITPTAIDGTDSRGIGIGMPMSRHGDGGGIACELAYNVGSGSPRLAFVDLTTNQIINTAPYNWDVGSTYIMSLQRTNDDYRCSVDGPNGERTQMTMRATTVVDPGYGLRAKGVSGTFDYLLLINAID